ncbi:hypothetical protein FRC10_010017 [Ceratobasidium sp. 414]|nr:hypothetical protein FRC10_010017 [Ceratobasidium sp. 414]
MVSVVKSALRKLKLIFTSGMSSSGLTETPAEPPNIFAFLPFLVDKCHVESVPKSYTPDELLELIMKHPNAVDSVGTIYVTEIQYWKEKSGPQHEYLVFEIQDTNHQFINYMRVDRFPDKSDEKVQLPEPTDDDAAVSHPVRDDSGATPYDTSLSSKEWVHSLFSSSSVSSWGLRNACDKIYISSSGNSESVHTSGKRNPLGSIKVCNDVNVKRPTLEQLVLLASFVSHHEPRYNLFRTQCYWYAYTIWRLLLSIFDEPVKYDGNLRGAGTITSAPWIEWHKGKRLIDSSKVTERETYASLAAEYLIAWSNFQDTVLRFQEQYGARAKQKCVQRAEEQARLAEGVAARAQEEAACSREEAARSQEEAARSQEEAARAREEIARSREEITRAHAETDRLRQKLELLELRSTLPHEGA